MADGIRVTIVGSAELQRRLIRIAKEQLSGQEQALLLAANDVRTEAVKSIQQGGRSGVTRVVTKSGKTHTASAPGEPPKTDTGSLVSSIFAELRKGIRPEAFVGSDIVYATHLEFGTSRMAARPWLHPAFVRMKPRIKKRLAQAFRRANRKK